MGAAASGQALSGAQLGLGFSSLLASRSQAKAIETQSRIESNQANFNAQLLSLKETEIAAQTEKDVERRRQHTKLVIGKQKAALAAQGITVEGELGQAFEEQEKKISQEDIEAIRNNAWKQAFGIQTTRSDILFQSKFAGLQAKQKSRETISTGGLNFASQAIKSFGTFKRFS